MAAEYFSLCLCASVFCARRGHGQPLDPFLSYADVHDDLCPHSFVCALVCDTLHTAHTMHGPFVWFLTFMWMFSPVPQSQAPDFSPQLQHLQSLETLVCSRRQSSPPTPRSVPYHLFSASRSPITTHRPRPRVCFPLQRAQLNTGRWERTREVSLHPGYLFKNADGLIDGCLCSSPLSSSFIPYDWSGQG